MLEIAYATAGLLEAPLPQADGSVLFTNLTAGGVFRYAEYAASRIRTVREGGAQVFAHAPRGECDGLAVDSAGGVWVALGSGAGIARFAPDGQLDRVVDVDTAFVSSLAFAGSTLYVTTAGALLTATMDVSGPPRPAASIPIQAARR